MAHRDQGRLFGKRGAPPGVRKREAAAVRRHVEELGALDPVQAARTGIALDLAGELDRLRSDDDHSGHTLATVGRAYLDTIEQIAAGLPRSDTEQSMDQLLAAILADDDDTGPDPTADRHPSAP